MHKFKHLFFLILFVASAAPAADPFWLEGKTDERYSITVYRSATCGCCKGWVAHLRQHNFEVEDVEVEDVNQYKQKYGVPPQAASCHTAVVNGVAVEGHVPAQDIKRLLADPGNVRLLAVPAMPSGTPGMDTPGSPKQEFRVYSVDRENNVDVFNHYRDY